VVDTPERRERIRTRLIEANIFPVVHWPLEETVLLVGARRGTSAAGCFRSTVTAATGQPTCFGLPKCSEAARKADLGPSVSHDGWDLRLEDLLGRLALG
jgi:hypothetical protein